MSTSSPLLSFDSISLFYGNRMLIEELSLELAAGQTCVIEGGNRSGKTSLVRALRRDGDEARLTGSVNFEGRSLSTLDAQAYRDAFVERCSFIDEDAGAELFPTERAARLFRSVPRAERRERFFELLSALGFAHPEMAFRYRVDELSRGGRLLVALALSLSNEPQLLVIDDVFFVCDALGTDQWLTHIRSVQERSGLAVLALCRSKADCSALHPKFVVELPERRPLASPAVGALSTLLAEPPVRVGVRRKAALKAQHLTVVHSRDVGRFRRPLPVFAVQSLSLNLWRGEVLAVVGASPSGKTTLAHALSRLLKPTFGRVFVRGKPARQRRRGERRVLACFEDARQSLDPRLTVDEQLREALALRASDVPAQAPEHLLSVVGLDASVLGLSRRHLSSGEAQLVALCRALCLAPSVLVLDNALSSVAQEHRSLLLQQLRERCVARGSSLLLLSNNLGALEKVTDRLGVMYAGRLVEIGPSLDVLSGRHHPYTRVLLSSRERARRGLQLIAEGWTPDASRLPSGCVYHPRCPNAEPGRCDTEEPALLPIGDDAEHRVACWHPYV